MEVPKRELLRTKNDKTAPLRTPTHVGCAFSIDREFFYEIGSYDEGMDIWGSENVELAFRVRKDIEITKCTSINRKPLYFLRQDLALWRIIRNHTLFARWSSISKINVLIRW